MSSALVVYSGGLDSYTLLNKALQNFKKVEAITFDYGQKHKKEIDYAKNNCLELGITHKVIKLDIADLLSNSALVGDSKIPEGNYDKEKMKQMAKKNPSMSHSHSNSVLLSPGEKGELVWKFSNKAKIEAACNVPGHYEVGMIAKINEI